VHDPLGYTWLSSVVWKLVPGFVRHGRITNDPLATIVAEVSVRVHGEDSPAHAVILRQGMSGARAAAELLGDRHHPRGRLDATPSDAASRPETRRHRLGRTRPAVTATPTSMSAPTASSTTEVRATRRNALRNEGARRNRFGRVRARGQEGRPSPHPRQQRARSTLCRPSSGAENGPEGGVGMTGLDQVRWHTSTPFPIRLQSRCRAPASIDGCSVTAHQPNHGATRGKTNRATASA
jgi:hypothetical protein